MLNNLTNVNWQYNGIEWDRRDKGEVWISLLPLICSLDHFNLTREANMIRNMQMYSNCYYTNAYQAFTLFNAPTLGLTDAPLIWNICKSAVDTVSAKISKNKIKITAVTDKSNWIKQDQTEQLDRAVYSLMYNSKFHNIAKQAFKDACVCGTGIIHCFRDGEGLKYERVLPFEILVDELDALYNNPTKMYRIKIVAKNKLIEMFPKYKDKISNVRGVNPTQTGIGISDSIVVYEAWSKAEQRHIIAIEQCDLVDEKWEDKDFPFLFIRWSTPSIGFWGIALIDEIASIQVEINKILFYTKEAFKFNSIPRIFAQANSVPKNQWSNKAGQVITYTGQLPSFQAPSPINPMVIDYLQMLKNEAYGLAGISQLSSQSQKPAGLNSGKALQTYNDIESERFILIGQAYEDLYLQAFERTIDIAKQIYAINPQFGVLSADVSEGLEEIKWSDINLDNDKYMVKAYPTSALPQQPEARYQRLEEMRQAGMIDNETFLELSDMPDIQYHTDLSLSSKKLIKAQLKSILQTKTYIRPDKFTNLDQAMTLALQMKAHLEVRNAPEDVRLVLESYIDDIYSLQQEAIAEQQAQQQQTSAIPPQ